MKRRNEITLAREAVKERFRGNSYMSKAEMTEITKAFMPAPDVRRLIDQDYGRQANYIARSIKDEKKQRSVFACKVEGMEGYINIDKTKSFEDVKKVKDDLQRKASGYAQSIEKADAVLEELQQSFDFEYDQSDITNKRSV